MAIFHSYSKLLAGIPNGDLTITLNDLSNTHGCHMESFDGISWGGWEIFELNGHLHEEIIKRDGIFACDPRMPRMNVGQICLMLVEINPSNGSNWFYET